MSIGAVVASVAPEDWVTESDIALRLKKPRQTIFLWVKGERRDSFPKPIIKLADKSPLWKWKEITQWLYKNKLCKIELTMDAEFLENVNVVLDERDVETGEYRNKLLQKLENRAVNR